MRNSWKSIAELMQYNADINSLNIEHRTPLHEAVIANQKEAVLSLIEYNCELEIQDVYEKTPAFYAQKNNNESILFIINKKQTFNSK